MPSAAYQTHWINLATVTQCEQDTELPPLSSLPGNALLPAAGQLRAFPPAEFYRQASSFLVRADIHRPPLHLHFPQVVWTFMGDLTQHDN